VIGQYFCWQFDINYAAEMMEYGKDGKQIDSCGGGSLQNFNRFCLLGFNMV